MGRKEFLKQIKSLQEKIKEHEIKINLEQQKTIPDVNRIKYWQKEIDAFKNAIIRAEKRLRRKK
jgi:peptidoglycan hydrolase CwlO-like protein